MCPMVGELLVIWVAHAAWAPEGLEGQSQEAFNRLLVLIYLQTAQANSSARKAENPSFDISPYSKIHSFQEYHFCLQLHCAKTIQYVN